jgi:hypothetical protein
MEEGRKPVSRGIIVSRFCTPSPHVILPYFRQILTRVSALKTQVCGFDEKLLSIQLDIAGWAESGTCDVRGSRFQTKFLY